MIGTLRVALLAASLSLAGCQDDPPTKNPGGASDIETGRPVDPGFTPQAASPPAPPRAGKPRGKNPTLADPYAGANDGYPDLTPTPTTPDAAKSDVGARAILLPWARGIELREFDQSWRMMGAAAQGQMSRAAFNTLFAPLHDLVVSVPGGTIEGAAGSVYYTVPTTITGTARDGSKRVIRGDVVMRRVDDVPGSTPEQLAWHIERVSLKPA